MMISIKDKPIGYFKALSKHSHKASLIEIRSFNYATKIYDEAEVLTLTDKGALIHIKYETRNNAVNYISIWIPRGQFNI